MYEEKLYPLSNIHNRFGLNYSTTRSDAAQDIDFHDELISYHMKIYHGISLVDPSFIMNQYI